MSERRLYGEIRPFFGVAQILQEGILLFGRLAEWVFDPVFVPLPVIREPFSSRTIKLDSSSLHFDYKNSSGFVEQDEVSFTVPWSSMGRDSDPRQREDY